MTAPAEAAAPARTVAEPEGDDSITVLLDCCKHCRRVILCAAHGGHRVGNWWHAHKGWAGCDQGAVAALARDRRG